MNIVKRVILNEVQQPVMIHVCTFFYLRGKTMKGGRLAYTPAVVAFASLRYCCFLRDGIEKIIGIKANDSRGKLNAQHTARVLPNRPSLTLMSRHVIMQHVLRAPRSRVSVTEYTPNRFNASNVI